jgi:hypothetical protein
MSQISADPQQKARKSAADKSPDSSEPELREKTFDKTLADSFPSSDPPSSIPDPGSDPAIARTANRSRLFTGLAPGTWVALSVDETQILSTGGTREEAEKIACSHGNHSMSLVEVPADPGTPLQSSEKAA